MLLALAWVALADEPPTWPDGTTLEVSSFEPEYDAPPADEETRLRRLRLLGIALRWSQSATSATRRSTHRRGSARSRFVQ